MIQAAIANAVIKLVAKQFKLDKVLEYVENPNDADKRIDELELNGFSLKQRVKVLEDVAHAPRNFIICDECKKKIKEKK